MLDELKPFDLAECQPFYPALDESKLANVALRLDRDRSYTSTQTERLNAILDRATQAAALLGRLPERHQSVHCVLRGTFALFDFVGAVLTLAGTPIDTLTVATLGFSKRNIDDLAALVDAGQVRNAAILCSHYFAAKDEEIYSHAVGFCQARGFPIVAMRTHAKVLLLAVGDHRLVVESSANLRSCHNCENATIFNDPGVYAFHRDWMQTLFDGGTA